MAQTAPVLDLTLNDRPTIRINGKSYEMRTSDEFAFLTFRQHQRKFQRLGELLRKKKTTQAEEKEMARLLDEFVRELVIAPAAVHDKMRDSHRLEIVKAFFSQPPASATRTAATKTRGRSTGMN